MITKVYGGQPSEGRSLCYTCRNCQFMRSSSLREDIYCHFLSKYILHNVTECSKYDPSKNPGLKQMEQIAWVVETRTRGPWGFEGEKTTKIVVRPPGEVEPSITTEDE